MKGTWLPAIAALSLIAASPPEPTAPDSIALDLVRSLSSEIGPRLAGSANDARARAWAIGKLKALGFSNVHEELFETNGWQRGPERAELIVPGVQPITVTAFGGSASTGAEGIMADIAYVASLDALKALPEGALAGRIAYVDSPNPTVSRLGAEPSGAAAERNGSIAMAASKGAVAVLLRSVASGTDRFAHTGQMHYREGAPRVPAGAVSLADADQLRRLAAHVVNLRMRLTLVSTDLGRVQSGNVVADLSGSDRPSEIILVGAHLDSWDLGTGALDDGTGVAIAIAAARRAAGQGRTKRTIRVVLFGAEETALDGARAYAKAHDRELSKHVLATEADFGAAPVWGFYTRVPPQMISLMDKIQEGLAPLGIERGHNHASGGEDLYFMREAGVPVASLVQDGTHYYDYHHSANDSFDKIDPAALEQNVKAFAIFLRLAASSEPLTKSS